MKRRTLSLLLVLLIILSSVSTVSRAASGTWKKNKKGWWWYEYADGSYAESEYIDGYWIDSDGWYDSAWNGSWKSNDTGWWFQSGAWYPVSDWLKVDGLWYYFKEDGYMAHSEWIGDYYVNEDGAWVPGMQRNQAQQDTSQTDNGQSASDSSNGNTGANNTGSTGNSNTDKTGDTEKNKGDSDNSNKNSEGSNISNTSDSEVDIAKANGFPTVEEVINSTEDISNEEALDRGYITPQSFGAVGDGINDDTEAFRRTFAAAFEQAYNTSTGWKHCRAIYIPSGNYLISGTVIDEMLETEGGTKVRYAMFEVKGAGRESTNITFTGNVLFDDQVHDESRDKMDEYSWKTPIFAFTTFSDIGFKGNQTNTFMNARDSRKYLKDENGNTILDENGNPQNFGTSDGAQRLQFISCSFFNWNKIINIIHSTCQLSEVTFAYCKIADCGNSSNECCLFTMNCSQAVDWRFDYTDIESINGEIFHYIEGANVWINGGSIIMNSGTAFFFDFSTGSRRDWAGESNSPHLLCTGSFFEIRCDKTHGYDSGLLKTTSFYEGSPNVVFRSCKMGTGSNNSPHYLEIDGAAEILFDNCYDCSKIQVSRNVGNINRYINPRLRFINCSDVNVNTLATTSTANTNEKYKYINASDFGTNNIRVSVDNTYDFYIRNNKQDNPNDNRAPYWHSTVGLNLCRQPVKLLRANAEKDKDGNVLPKLFKTKPYGYVEKIEITIPANNYAGTMTIYDSTTGKVVGESIQLKSSENKKYELNVGAYIEEFRIEFSETPPYQPNINMDIIKY